jgi:hypothetical protein
MAQLVIAAAGAAVGFMVGGPMGASIGRALGSALGGSMAPATKIQGSQQALMDLTVTGTAYGQAIPFLRGSVTVAGQVWWNTDRRPVTTTTTTHSGGGKGGGGGGTDTTSSTITYNMDMLIGLSDNPIVGVSRIWLDGALIYTAAVDATSGSLAASAASTQWSRLTVYTGADDQLPDPTYEAAVGMGAAPAYRGRGSVFIEGLQLGQSGQVPNLTFEVVTDGSVYGSGFATFDPAKQVAGYSIFYYPYLPAGPYVETDCAIYITEGYVTYQWFSAAPNLFKSAGKYYCEFALFDNPGPCRLAGGGWDTRKDRRFIRFLPYLGRRVLRGRVQNSQQRARVLVWLHVFPRVQGKSVARP